MGAFEDFVFTELPRRPWTVNDGLPGQMLVRSKDPLHRLGVEWADPVGSSEPVSYFKRTAGEILSALRVVWEDVDGKVYALDVGDIDNSGKLCGLTITSSSLGDDIHIQRTGWVGISGLGLNPGKVWLGDNGVLTQSPPTAGFLLCVGNAVSSEDMFLDFKDIVILGD